MGAATRPAREFCAMCGWPLRGPRCDACGESRLPLALEDSTRRFAPRGHEGLDATGLDKATDAFRRGDFPRAINACLSIDARFSLRTVQLSEGPGWMLLGKDATAFVFVDLVTSVLVVEAPIVLLPKTQRVAAMRRALELCDDDRMSSRLCLRDDLLLLRFAAQVAAVPPLLVRHVVGDMLATSERYADLFVAAFDARRASRDDGGVELLGKKRKLHTMQVGASRTSIVPPPPSTVRPDFSAAGRADDMPPVLSAMFASDGGRSAADDIPAILAPSAMLRERNAADDMPPILAPQAMLRERSAVDDMPPILAPLPLLRDRSSTDDMPAILAPPSMSRDRSSTDDMPAILAPPMSEGWSSSDAMDGMPAVLMPLEPPAARGGGPPSSTIHLPGSAPTDREASPSTSRFSGMGAGVMSVPAQGASPNRQRTAMGLTGDGGVRASNDAETDTSGRKQAAPLDKNASPPEKLCDLMQRARTLASSLSFAERQATMLLLVRATVYRAVYEFAETVPDAVSYLHRMTAAVTRQVWSSKAAPDKNAPMPMGEPSLLAMERVVSLRAQVPKEPKLSVDPLKTAGQAREHLSRYVEEIELAPADLALRHFLALGALSELLVRARLPSQTGQRIKDIVAHAQREISKPALTPEQTTKALTSTLDLMMAALKRIIAG